MHDRTALRPDAAGRPSQCRRDRRACAPPTAPGDSPRGEMHGLGGVAQQSWPAASGCACPSKATMVAGRFGGKNITGTKIGLGDAVWPPPTSLIPPTG